MHVSELTREQLDYWVAKAQKMEVYYEEDSGHLVYLPHPKMPARKWRPTHFWSQGGPIIEHARIDLNWDTEGNGRWSASIDPDILADGETVLEAAMRAFVHARLGEELG